MKRITLMFALALAVFGLQAQTANATLDKIIAKTNGNNTVRIDFAYSAQNRAQNLNESVKGVLYSRGDAYNLKFGDQEVISDGKTTWTFLRDVNEVQINDASLNGTSPSPTQLLGSYKTDFKSRNLAGTSGQYQIELVPLKPATKPYSKVHVFANKSNSQLSKMVIYDKNGTVYTYAISRVLPDPFCSEDTFRFNKSLYPGVEVVDMR